MDPGDGFTSSGTGASTLSAPTAAGNTPRGHLLYIVYDGDVIHNMQDA